MTSAVHPGAGFDGTGDAPLPKLGSGLVFDPAASTVRCTLAGRLTQGHGAYYVRANARRYVPRVNDRVIGIVEERTGGDQYRVNLFGPQTATLPVLAFEGATKRNRPQLDPGAAVYCRVERLRGGTMEPAVTCKVGHDGAGGASRRDWMTEEGTYGPLKGGTQLRISLGLARELLKPHNVVLNTLGTLVPFEVAVGVNGVLWVHSGSMETTVLVCNAVKNSEVMTDAQVRGMVKELIKRMNLDVSHHVNKANQ